MAPWFCATSLLFRILGCLTVFVHRSDPSSRSGSPLPTIPSMPSPKDYDCRRKCPLLEIATLRTNRGPRSSPPLEHRVSAARRPFAAPHRFPCRRSRSRSGRSVSASCRREEGGCERGEEKGGTRHSWTQRHAAPQPPPRGLRLYPNILLHIVSI